MRIVTLLLRNSLVPLVLLMALALTTAASAATITWNGGSGGLWEDPTKWLPQQAPGQDDTAIIGGTQETLVVVTGSRSVATLVIANPNATLMVEGTPHAVHGDLRVANGFENRGTIELTSTNVGYAAFLTVTTGSLTNAPGGAIRALEGAGGQRTLNANLVNQGTLELQTDLTASGNIVNGGVVHLPPAKTLTISGTTIWTHRTGAITGTGTLSLPGNSTLVLEDDFTPGTFALQAPALTVDGPGRLLGPAAGEFVINNWTINAPVVVTGDLVIEGVVSLNGSLVVSTGKTLRITGTLHGVHGDLRVANGFENHGTIELTSTNVSYAAFLTVTTGSLTNAPGGVIRALEGAGGPRTLNANLVNQGALLVLDGSNLQINGVLLNAPTGILGGGGTFQFAAGMVSNEGAVAPGVSPGRLSVDGDLPWHSSARFEVEIGGFAAGTDHDQLALSSPANLNGTIAVEWISGFFPKKDDAFTVLTYPSRTGGFSTLHNPLSERIAWEVRYNAADAQLVVLNTAPTLAEIADQTVNELTPLTVTAGATDQDQPAQTLTYTLVTAPAGMTIHPSSGLISWTPSESQGPGEFEVTVRVQDNGTPTLGHTTRFSVNVLEVNAAPELTLPATGTVDEQAAFTFAANATDTDLPANTLTYELVSGPEGATLNPATREFRWTPSEEQGPGTHDITLRVTDNGNPALAHTTTLNVTVREVNRPPVLNDVPGAAIHAGAAFRTSLTGSDPDIPANALTYSMVSGPDGATVTPDGRVEWRPSLASAGSIADFTVRVTDNGVPPQSDDVTFQVAVADPLTILDTRRSGDEWTITWRAVAGNRYRVIQTTSLPASEWSPIPGEVTATGDSATKTFTTSRGFMSTFLRVMLVE